MSSSAEARSGFPRAVEELNALFAQGHPPDPSLDGRYAGSLVRTTIHPVADALAAGMGSVYMGWLGKQFDAAQGRGDNHFRGSMEGWTRWLWPHYEGIRPCGDGTFDAFGFRTWTGAGLLDPEVQVLKIDYDLPESPYSLRRILDELVQLPDGRLLGKAQLLTWWGQWTTIAYFALAPEVPPGD
jgi:hypothetical protein